MITLGPTVPAHGAPEETELVVELRGRIGNQLFLWASGTGIARATGATLRLWNRVPDEDLLLPRLVGSAYREADPRDLWRYGLAPQAPRPEHAWRLLAHWYGKVRRRIGRGAPQVAWAGPFGSYRPELMDATTDTLVRDWLQSERFFVDVAAEVAAAVEFPAALPGLPPALARPMVAVSFRRGDYNAMGAALPLGYYERALAVVRERVGGDGSLVVFADDAAFARLATDWLAADGRRVLNALTVAADPLGQLRLMADCDHHVIANSSFAWWGAWLGEHRGGSGTVVVAPTEYRGAGDRLPARWATVPGGVPGDVV